MPLRIQRRSTCAATPNGWCFEHLDTQHLPIGWRVTHDCLLVARIYTTRDFGGMESGIDNISSVKLWPPVVECDPKLFKYPANTRHLLARGMTAILRGHHAPCRNTCTDEISF